MKNERRLTSILIKCLTEHYAKKRKVSIKTKANYQLRFNNILEFLGSNSCILINEVDLEFVDDFRTWAYDRFSFDHANRNIELLKKATSWSKTKGIIKYDPLEEVETGREAPVTKISLIESEVNLMYEAVHKFELSKNYFVLGCRTGLSYSDYSRFDVRIDERGEWVHGNRFKPPHNEYWIPMHPQVKAILKKYKGKLPPLSVHTFNYQIKVIARDLKIDKKLSTHIARKTFASICYNHKGISEDTTADSMAISNLTLNKYYLLKTRKRIENEYGKFL